MKYVETGFRAVYGNFTVFPVNENTRASIAGFPGEDRCNCILVYGFMDEKEGMSLEVLACGIGQGNNFRFYDTTAEIRSHIRISAVLNDEFFFLGNGESHLAVRYHDKLEILKGIKPSEELEETRMMTFLDSSRDMIYVDNVKVFLTKDGLPAREVMVHITGTGDNCIIGELLDEPGREFGCSKGDTIAFFVNELEGGRIICAANMNRGRTYTRAELEDGSLAEEYIEAFRKNRNEDTYIDVLEILRDSDVWVPCNVELSEDQKMKLFPDVLKKNGKAYFPVFTSEKEMDAYNGRFAKVRKTFLEAIDMAEAVSDEIEGIAVNPFGNLFTLRRDMWHAVRIIASRIKEA